jgi:hypothetical protein
MRVFKPSLRLFDSTPNSKKWFFETRDVRVKREWFSANVFFTTNIRVSIISISVAINLKFVDRF